jgi:hypothetical protein
VYANDDAIRHYQFALQALADATSETADAHRAELDARERLADLLALTGQRSDALAQYDTVMAAVAKQPDPVRAARVLRKTGGLHWEANERERAAECFDAGPGAARRARRSDRACAPAAGNGAPCVPRRRQRDRADPGTARARRSRRRRRYPRRRAK